MSTEMIPEDLQRYAAFPGMEIKLPYLPEELYDTGQMIALTTYEPLGTFDVQQEVREIMEQDTVHGGSHISRLEGWYVQFVLQSEVKNQPFFLEYGRSAIDAIARHDIVETVARDKNKHGPRAAWYSLATDTVIEDNYDEYSEKMGLTMSQEQWNRKKWATAFEIYYHHPEGMPTTDEIMERGYLLDAHELVKEAGEFADIFPPYRDVQYVTDRLLMEPQPNFSHEEIEAIRTHAYLVAAADKMDQTAPVALSINRMILLNPGRDLYIPWFKQKKTDTRTELEGRRQNGGQSESVDDASRLFFEACRYEAFNQAPEAVQKTYTIALRNKYAFLTEALPKFMTGDFKPFLRIYDDMKKDALENILIGLGVEESNRDKILRNEEVPFGSSVQIVRSILMQYRMFDVRVIDSVLETIETERSSVEANLNIKYAKLRRNYYHTQYHQRKIAELLAETRNILEGKLNPGWRGDIQLPFQSYHPIRWSQFTIQQMQQ